MRVRAKRKDSCSRCWSPIEKGAMVEWDRDKGTVCDACLESNKDAIRTNSFPTICCLCGEKLAKGEGRADYQEQEINGQWVRSWKWTCLITCS